MNAHTGIVGGAPAMRAARTIKGPAFEPTLPFNGGIGGKKTLADVPTAPGTASDDSPATRYQLLVIARTRIAWLVIAFLLAATLAIGKILWLGIAGPGPAFAPSNAMAASLVPPRGEITDRNAKPLALTYPALALWFNPKAMGDEGAPLVRPAQEVAAKLKAIFPDMDEAAIAKRLEAGRATYLRRRILPEEANKVQAIGEIALEVPQEADRYYPQGSLAAHILGYVVEGEDNERSGRVGMEWVLDERLSDAQLRAQPAALSIDLRVQGALEDELRSGMLAADAKGAAGIVLDANTGEVMAMASLPDFDPNRIAREDVPNMENRVTNQVSELGSTFKPLTIAAAIDAGIVRDLGARWDAAPVKIGSRTLADYEDKGPTLNIAQALAYSSNTVTMRVADKLGPDRLRNVMVDLGMNERPFIELPARGMPLWPKGKWSRITTMTVSYGHGIAVTPLHLASAYAAMVNGGIWRPATLTKLAPEEVPRGKRVFKASTSSRMRQLLRMISIYGTGRKADAAGYRVGGKTGSAEKNVGGRYLDRKLMSTFASAFPMDRPEYVVVVTLDEPKGTRAASGQRTAAWNAAPIVGQLVPRIGPMLGVRPDNRRDVDISDLRYLIEGKK